MKENWYYISDMHIDYKIRDFADLEKVINKAVSDIVNSLEDGVNRILVLGDVCHSFQAGKLFFTALSRATDATIFAILGNHELWDVNPYTLQFNRLPLEIIIQKWKFMLDELGIYLIQNEICFIKKNQITVLSYRELKRMSDKRLESLSEDSDILIGGIGFAGYNSTFNVRQGIYRVAIRTADAELVETKKFEDLYLCVKNTFENRKVIVATHMPKTDWSEDRYNENWVYASGHTHINEAHDNVQSDNQIGYDSQEYQLKKIRG